jgi:hypothetical protein
VKQLKETFSPLYFLSALGAGGLAVSFYMYPFFMIKHPDSPMLTFNHVWPLLTQGPAMVRVLLGLDILVILYLALLHLRLLWWNLAQWRAFKATPAYRELMTSNAEISVMTIPLTLAMTINVLFVLGALCVPDLWSVVEWLFPGAIAAFLAVGVYALRVLLQYFARVFSEGGVDFATNNSLAPMIAIFALSMVAVGLAAPAAMSQTRAVQVTAMLLSLFFFSGAVLLAGIKLVLGFQSMMQHGINVAASPSLWVMIPIITLLGITWIRLSHGLHAGLGAHGEPTSLLVWTGALLSMQLLFGLIGWVVMKRLGYFEKFSRGPHANAGTFALVCPGVALVVFGFFFLHTGLVRTGVIEALSAAYLMLLLPFVVLHAKTVQVMWRLNRKVLGV